MRVYQVFDKKNHEGKYYKEWDLPDGFPVPQGYIFIPPTEGLKNPKFNTVSNKWEEDKENLLNDIAEDNKDMRREMDILTQENEDLKKEIIETKQRALMTEEAILDLATMIISV